MLPEAVFIMADTQRYRREVNRNGSSVFVRRRPLLPLGREDKLGKLCGEVLMIALPPEFLRESRQPLPGAFRVAIAEEDAALDRAFSRLQGLNAGQLTEVVEGLVRRILDEHRDRLLEAGPRMLLTFLDRQLHQIGMEVVDVHHPV
jgi:hypothetical protein